MIRDVGRSGVWGRSGRSGGWDPLGARASPDALANFVKVTATVIALTHVRHRRDRWPGVRESNRDHPRREYKPALHMNVLVPWKRIR